MGAKNPAARYKSSHWGISHRRVYEVEDIPGRAGKALTQMGQLRELHVRARPREPVAELRFPRSNLYHLAFSTDRAERLYIVTPPQNWAWNTQHLLVADGDWYPLAEVAKAAGGRQARYPYPNVQVQVLGRLERVVYATEKKGDGPSEYVHRMGEEGGVEPYLAVDEAGRLWVAGGSYSVPDPGITH